MRYSAKLVGLLSVVLMVPTLSVPGFAAAAEPSSASTTATPLAQTTQAADRLAEADALFREAVQLWRTSNYQAAWDKFQQALAIYQAPEVRAAFPQESQQGVAKTLTGLGAISSSFGQYPQALEYYEQALAIQQEISDRRGEGVTLNNIGLIYDSLGDYQEALAYFERSLDIRTDLGDRRGEAVTLNNIGLIYDSLGDYQEALAYYQRALAILQEIGDRNGEGTTLNNIGSIYSSLGDYQEALAYYQRALAIRQEIGDRNGEGTSLNSIGSIYSSLGEYQEALSYYQRALAIRQEIGDRNGEGTSLNNIGFIYASLGDYQEALAYYQRALAIRQEIGDRQGEGNSLNNIGGIYSSLGEYQEALTYYQRALAIRQEIGDRNGEGVTLNGIGFIYDSLGDYQKALSYFERALAILQEIGDRQGEGTSLNNIGFIYYRQGQYQEALSHFQQSLAIRQEIGDRRGEAESLNNIGFIYSSLGDYQEALAYYQRALAIRQEISDRQGEGNSLNNIGFIYASLGDYQEALAYYQRALVIQQEISDRNGKGWSLNNIGGIYSRLGDYQEALAYYQRALAILQEIGDRNGEGNSLSNIGFIYSRLGDHQEALDYYQRALVIRTDIGDRNGEAITLNNLGLVYYRLREYQEALGYYQQALAILQSVGDRASEAITLNNIGHTLDIQNQSELAIVFLKQSVNVYEAIRGDLRTLDTDLQSSYTDSIAGTYRNLADLLLQQDRVLEAQRVLDLLKVQELEDYLQDVRGNANTASGIEYWRPEQEILDRYQTLQASAIALGTELAALNARKNAGQITPAEEQRRLQLAELQTELAGQFNDFIASADMEQLLDQLDRRTLRQSVDLEDLSGLRNNLEELNAALIYPLILDDRIELVITTANTEPLRRTLEGVGRTQLNAAITAFRQALEDPRSDAQTPAQQLYQWLIEPLEPDLKAAGVDTLIYSPDGALRYIPLGALYDGDQWLAQRFRINNITARSLQELTAQPQPNPRILAGAFADRNTAYAVGGMNFWGLPFAGEEVDQVKTALPNTTALIDQRFSLQEVVADLGRFNVLHFATHAAFLPGDPTESFILFGNGDAPTLKDIETWPLANVDLVVLSACETGLGGFDNNGEQILGLGYQFQSRGAKAVIASLWQVNDNSTQILMTAFYAALQQGMTKTAALQAAQEAMITGDFSAVGSDRGTLARIGVETSGSRQRADSLSHPYYWAPFILIGNGL